MIEYDFGFQIVGSGFSPAYKGGFSDFSLGCDYSTPFVRRRVCSMAFGEVGKNKVDRGLFRIFFT